MLEELRLGGFKAFSEPQNVPLRQITLIFGANSSGKSSILQSLLLLKQTVDEAGESTTVLLPRGSLVNLGTYRDMVHRGEMGGEIEVGLKWTGPVSDRTIDRLGRRGRPPLQVSEPWYNMRFSARPNGRIQLNRFAVGAGAWEDVFAHCDVLPQGDSTGNQQRARERQSLRGMPLTAVDSASALAEAIWQAFRGNLPRVNRAAREHVRWQREMIMRNYRAHRAALPRTATEPPDEVHFEASLRQGEDAIEGLERLNRAAIMAEIERRLADERVAVRQFLPWRIRDTEYLARSRHHDLAEYDSPLPLSTLRPILDAHAWLSAAEVSVLFGAQVRAELARIRYIGALREQPERYAVPNGGAVTDVGRRGQFTADLLLSRPEMRTRVNEALQRLGVGYDMEAVSFGEDKAEDLQVLRFRERGTNLLVSPSDVGFGVSQILPVVVQSLATQDGLIMIEEPESHLHPRLQAELGDLFALGARESKNQYIIETHSEHLILRLQRLIRTGELTADQVRVLYVRKVGTFAQIHDLEIDENGDFVGEWPDGFFPERLNELV